jgi:hypothetical protein
METNQPVQATAGLLAVSGTPLKPKGNGDSRSFPHGPNQFCGRMRGWSRKAPLMLAAPANAARRDAPLSLPNAEPAMPFGGAVNPRSAPSEHSPRGRLDLSRNPLSSSRLAHTHEAPRERCEPSCYHSNGTSDFRMVLTEHLQGVTMPAVGNAVEAERQWNATGPTTRPRDH